MKNFACSCGQRIFFENTQCMNCKRFLGYDFVASTMMDFSIDGNVWTNQSGDRYRPCKNSIQYGVCNWMISEKSDHHYCLSCSLNKMIPAITAPKKRQWWLNMETAKRRLVVTLQKLNLPLESKHNHDDGLAFAFLEDKRMNPAVKEEFVATGHKEGLITVNLAEADDARRERTRVEMGELYRTLLGHFRHESGHYYFERLLRKSPLLEEFRQLFGDERADYNEALKKYYQDSSTFTSNSDFISDYAQSHPFEDWAECWAHYLHMVDTLETASWAGIIDHDMDMARHDIDQWLNDWSLVTIKLNSLNRSMGLKDAYPFVLSEKTLTKIRFVHQVVNPK
ncbi:MAG: putative zinc-binding peptidase [Cellvibrionaceae bacterium]